MGHLYEEYEILRQIGTGGFSRVYKAVPKDLSLQNLAEGKDKETDFEVDELVAVKVVRSRPYDCELKRVAQNEVELMKELSSLEENTHNIVQLVQVFEEAKRIAIVMEYLDGGELFERIILRSKYSEQDACGTIKCITQALNAIHSIDIIHRDIKPENLVYKYSSKQSSGDSSIFIDDSSDLLKLMDFGLSINLNRQDPHAEALYVGTPGYIAPEVIQEGAYSPKSDIFSLGVILFILLSGRMPFSGKTSTIINTKILQGKVGFNPRFWSGISPEARDLVNKMLHTNPEERISGEEILKHKWLRNCEGGGLRKWINPLPGIRETYEKSKFGERIREVFTNVRETFKNSLDKLLEKKVPTGFAIEDVHLVKDGFIDREVDDFNPSITRKEFKETMEKLGFAKLPLEEIFDVVYSESQFEKEEQENSVRSNENNRKSVLGRVKQSLKGSVRKRNNRHSATRLSFKRWKPSRTVEITPSEIDRQADTIKLDDILVGLATVASMKDSEHFLHVLFEIFQSQEAGPRNENGLTERGFNNVAKVLGTRSALQSSSEEADTRSKRRRKKMATNLSLLFANSLVVVAPDTGGEAPERRTRLAIWQGNRQERHQRYYVKLEEFQTSINKLGSDFMKNLFGEGEENIVRKGLDTMFRRGATSTENNRILDVEESEPAHGSN